AAAVATLPRPGSSPLSLGQSDRGAAAPRVDWPLLLMLLWVGGLAARLLWLGLQLLRVRRVVASARAVSCGRAGTAMAVHRQLTLRRPVRLLESDRVTAPVTC